MTHLFPLLGATPSDDCKSAAVRELCNLLRKGWQVRNLPHLPAATRGASLTKIAGDAANLKFEI